MPCRVHRFAVNLKANNFTYFLVKYPTALELIMICRQFINLSDRDIAR